MHWVERPQCQSLCTTESKCLDYIPPDPARLLLLTKSLRFLSISVSRLMSSSSSLTYLRFSAILDEFEDFGITDSPR